MIAVLTSKTSWFYKYAVTFVKSLNEKNYKAALFSEPENIDKQYTIVFILSYFKILKKEFLLNHKYNLVVHESALPEGKGWAPLFWQILEGKNEIPVVLFEATNKADSGDIYLEDKIILVGDELNHEIRCKQAEVTIKLCFEFLKKHNQIVPSKQQGPESFFPKRTTQDSELDINRSIKSQINLLRIVDNEEYPAFFNYKNEKYILKIYKSNRNENS